MVAPLNLVILVWVKKLEEEVSLTNNEIDLFQSIKTMTDRTCSLCARYLTANPLNVFPGSAKILFSVKYIIVPKGKTAWELYKINSSFAVLTICLPDVLTSKLLNKPNFIEADACCAVLLWYMCCNDLCARAEAEVCTGQSSHLDNGAKHLISWSVNG